MKNDWQKKQLKQINSVTVLAIVVNFSLFVLKLVVGFLNGSVALVADGVHSLSDLSTDIIVIFGHYFGSKKPDRNHPYGHGRIETLSAILIALFLIVSGAMMIFYAASTIGKITPKQPGLATLIAASVSVFVKELLYRITRKVSIVCNSAALYANAWHHRSDALSSIAVFIGVLSIRFGFSYGDQIAAIAVGLMIIMVGLRITASCLGEFTDKAVDEETVGHIEDIIKSNKQIRQWHKLRTRTIGREIFLDLHILVDPALNITDAHRVAETLEDTIHEQLVRPVNITVHIEPDIPSMRK